VNVVKTVAKKAVNAVAKKIKPFAGIIAAAAFTAVCGTCAAPLF